MGVILLFILIDYQTNDFISLSETIFECAKRHCCGLYNTDAVAHRSERQYAHNAQTNSHSKRLWLIFRRERFTLIFVLSAVSRCYWINYFDLAFVQRPQHYTIHTIVNNSQVQNRNNLNYWKRRTFMLRSILHRRWTFLYCCM